MMKKYCTSILAGLFTGVLFTAQLNADVRINEFVASNSDGLTDSTGVAADWIELFNDGDTAVNIGGYYLTDDSSNLTRWKFPSPTTLAAGGYLIVFMDGTLTAPVAGRELHTNFSLSKTGEYLALVAADGQTLLQEFSPAYPEQYTDISYGISQNINELVNSQSTLEWEIPTSSTAKETGTGVGAVGFTANTGSSGFTVSYYHLNVSGINTTTEAENYIKNKSYWRTDTTYPVVGVYDTINFADSSSPGNFTPDTPFPTHSSTSVDKDCFVIVAEADVLIPRSGLWTFACNSDDGFSLAITGNGVNFVCEYPNTRGMSVTLGSYNFPSAGVYQARLLFFESGGGAGVELSAAEGRFADFESSKFRLVGDVANGGLSTTGAIEAAIDTDMGTAMKGINSRININYPFNLEELPGENSTLTLAIRYVDGFTAWLNGTYIARVNSPANFTWNSTATKTRTLVESLVWDEISVPLNLLNEGANILKITGLNNTASDSEFLIQPRLTLIDNTEIAYRYFLNPSPEEANGSGLLAKTAEVKFSHDRGYCETPFVLTINCDDSEAQIRYTLDGSTPTETTGTAYTTPITISKTTVLRAISYRPSHIPSDVLSRTWIFLDDVFKQSSTPPTGWPSSGAVNSHSMYYGMNSSVVNSSTYGDRLREGFKDIKTLSLVTDLDNLFNAQTGIYVNPGNSGIAWERPVSVELIDPEGGDEFQINAGLRIRGAASRTIGNVKHSFRLFFRGKYGASSLVFPMFGEEGTSEFDKIDLRTEQNHSWHREAPSTYTAVREVFARDSQKAAGVPYTRTRYYHLFLNGLYWGLYQTQERVDADYAVSYMGGESEDWDCIKTESSSSRATVAGDGNLDAWLNFYNICMQGYTGSYSNNYNKVRGLNPDGTRNLNYPILLDEDNLIKFMINAYFTGDPDNPYSLFGNFPNNLFALYNHTNPSGIKWFRHDAEHSLAANRGDWGLDMDYTAAGWNRTAYSQFEPIMMHLTLVKNEEYKMRFADIVQEQFFENGIFTPESCIARYQARMNEIDHAVIGESARWGAAMGSLRTRDVDWINENNYMLQTYFPQRSDIVLQQFKNQGWFPSSVTAPSSTLKSGMCAPGEAITLQSETSFYYTTDGSDPRLPGGGINPSAILVSGGVPSEPISSTLIIKGDTWKYNDLGATPANRNNLTWKAITYSDTDWGEGPGRLGFGNGTVATTTTRTTTDGVFVNTTYFRKKFTVDSTNGITKLKLSLNRDDGAIVYLNGPALLRDNIPPGTVDFSTFSAGTISSPEDAAYNEFTLPSTRLRNGSNVISVEVHQCNGSSSDMYFDMELVATGNTSGGDSVATSVNLNINENQTLMLRSYNGGVWSPIKTYNYIVQQNYDALRISEMMYSPALNDGDTGSYDDYAWLEICNTGRESVNMQDVKFTVGIDYTFPSIVIPAGGYLVLAKNAEFFASRYNTNSMLLVSGYSGNLARKGETITLETPDAIVIQSYAYERKWYSDADRTGYSLEVINLDGPLDAWSDSYNWYPSSVLGGTPGYAAAMLEGAADQMIPVGNSTTIVLSGSAAAMPVAPQWYHYKLGEKWELLENESSTTLRLDAITAEDAGLYMAKFESDGKTSITEPTELMVLQSQPQSLRLYEGDSGALTIDVSLVSPNKLQWQKYTAANQWEDVINGMGLALPIEYATGFDSGHYRVAAFTLADSSSYGWYSDEAILTVETETIPPEVASVKATDSTYIEVLYSEYVSTATALKIENYTLDGGATILNIAAIGNVVSGGVKGVYLETTTLLSGSVYKLVINGVCDISSNSNVIAANTTRYIQTEPAGQGLLRQVWYGCSDQLNTMTDKSTYPNSPDMTSYLSSFETPTDWGDYYGQRVTGLLIPPTTGLYTFWIASDDYSELYLSTDSTPAKKRRIAYVSGWTNSREWTKYTSQKSATISLTANTPYYVEAIHTEGTGGDNLAVQWLLPTGVTESPIPQSRIYPPGASFGAPEIVLDPQSISCPVGGTAVFEVFIKSGIPPTYAWEINGVTSTTETNRILTLTGVQASDNGLRVRCKVTNSKGVKLSSYATLTIEAPLQEVQILTQPIGGIINEGESYTLTVVASGSEPITYQWYRNALPVGENTPTLTTTEAGKYLVKVSNSLNSVTSEEVEVTVKTIQVDPPTLNIRGTSDQLVIHFTGRLQLCTSLEEDRWIDLAIESESPIKVVPTEKKVFFRAVK